MNSDQYISRSPKLFQTSNVRLLTQAIWRAFARFQCLLGISPLARSESSVSVHPPRKAQTKKRAISGAPYLKRSSLLLDTPMSKQLHLVTRAGEQPIYWNGRFTMHSISILTS